MLRLLPDAPRTSSLSFGGVTLLRIGVLAGQGIGDDLVVSVAGIELPQSLVEQISQVRFALPHRPPHCDGTLDGSDEAVANSASMPSPISLTMWLRYSAIFGSICSSL